MADFDDKDMGSGQENKNDDLISGFEKIVMAGIVAVSKTAETAGELLTDLVKKGELTVEQGKVLNEELKHNLKGKVADVKESVKSSAVNQFVAGMDKLSPEDLEKIKSKLAQMDESGSAEGE